MNADKNYIYDRTVKNTESIRKITWIGVIANFLLFVLKFYFFY